MTLDPRNSSYCVAREGEVCRGRVFILLSCFLCGCEIVPSWTLRYPRTRYGGRSVQVSSQAMVMVTTEYTRVQFPTANARRRGRAQRQHLLHGPDTAEGCEEERRLNNACIGGSGCWLMTGLGLCHLIPLSLTRRSCRVQRTYSVRGIIVCYCSGLCGLWVAGLDDAGVS